MSPYSETILTNMCMVYRKDGSFVVVNRLKNDWPGLNFPGGHVERGESIAESAIREVEEETGLRISSLEPSGYYEWNEPDRNRRHLALLFRSDRYSGVLRGSPEGPVFWIRESELPSHPLSTDFLKVLAVMKKGLIL